MKARTVAVAEPRISRPRQWLARLAISLGWWSPLRLLAPAAPSQGELDALLAAEWPEYANWFHSHEVADVATWTRLREQSLAWRRPPRISLVTPTYNTDPNQLEACLHSVRTQSYPFWQLCVVDDCSPMPDVLATLRRWASREPRIVVRQLDRNRGICAASNAAIGMATGDYVAFLDHDDVLAPDALHRLAEAVRDEPGVDIFYSDRDMLSVNGRRFMHLLKPAWSPETLLSGNYLFHLTAYRRTLLAELGGLRAGYEGSQDYDLALRATEVTTHIRHIPRVLYHWREHEASIATNAAAKRYVYDAGKAALADAMRRRGFEVPVSDVPGFRGHYRPELPLPQSVRVAVVRLEVEEGGAGYAVRLAGEVARQNASADVLVVLGPGVVPHAEAAVDELVRWLQLPGVGFATGRVVTHDGHLAHVGLVHRPSGVPLSLYERFAASEPGYMAYAAVMRNVSAPHPWCVAFRREAWDAVEGRCAAFAGPHAILDRALRCLEAGWRTVYVPYAEFLAADAVRFATPWVRDEAQAFAREWQMWLARGDPFYPWGMSLASANMTLTHPSPVPPVAR